MPDPAVEAAYAGLSYHPPPKSPSGLKGAKVRWVNDPTNPYAAPKRVIEKMGFWERTFGSNKDDSFNHPKLNQYGYTPSAHSQGQGLWNTSHTPSSHSQAQNLWTSPIPRPLPIIASNPTTNIGNKTALRLTPFPLNFDYLSRAEKKLWESQRKEEVKYLKAVEVEQRALEIASRAEKIREVKLAEKQAELDLKSRKKAMKLEKKLGYRPLPQYIPPQLPLPGGATYKSLPTSQPPPQVSAGLGQPSSWMLLPTLEQFGVRRPFDAPGIPDKIHTIGGTEWPMMSRTMTHAMQDMYREERVHLDQAGHTWSPGWYRD